MPNLPTKICSNPKCNKELPATTEYFYTSKKSKDSLRPRCKECHKKYAEENAEHIKEYKKEHYQQNKDQIAEQGKKYYEDNKEEILKRNKKYRTNNKDKVSQQRKEYRTKNQHSLNEYFREYRLTNPNHRLAQNLRNNLNKKLTQINVSKDSSTIQLLGCTINEFRSYLEKLWLPNMSWDNYGVYKNQGTRTWHIDHIKPCSLFDLTDIKQQKECFHYSNMQPMWADENIAKSNKY